MSLRTIVFSEEGEFAAFHAAEKWLTQNGYSRGSWQRGAPCGIVKGDALISKWRNMTEKEREALDGRMSGDGRNGPITISYMEKP